MKYPSDVPSVILMGLFFFTAIPLHLLLSESIRKDAQPPPAPSLSWSPLYNFFIRGERIKLECSIPEGQSGERICFSHTKGKGQRTECKEGDGSTMEFSTLRLSPNVAFHCSYLGRNAEGRTSKSEMSKQVEISVIDRPPAPSLSPSEPLYLVGEKVTLRCSASNIAHQSWRRYHFAQITEDQTSKENLDWHEDPSLVLTATRENAGRYACLYLEEKYERNISSEWSRPASILVRDPPPPPVLRADPPSGAVGEGEPPSIFCLSKEGNNPKRFHFSRDGVEMSPSTEGPLRSSRAPGDITLNMSVAFLDAKHHKSGGFACRYEENINGRWIMSSWSQVLNVTVPSAPLAPSLGYAALALLVPFLGAPLAFCWSRRKNASGCQHKPEPKEKEEETKLNDLGSERLEREDLQNSELTYAFVHKLSAVTPLGPRTENHLKTMEGDRVVYSELRLQATSSTAESKGHYPATHRSSD